MKRKAYLIALLAGALSLALLIAGCGGKPAATPAAEAAPAVQAPAAAAPAAAPAFTDLVLSYDMVRGSKNIAKEDQAVKGCALNNRFLRNEEVVFRVRVMDPVTGTYLDNEALGKLEIKFADGTVLTPKYGPHPKNDPTDSYWTAAWLVPENYPSGTVNLTFDVAAADGRSQTKNLNFVVTPTLLTILDGSVPVLQS